jgi:tRNA threonylcarbamoyladenosine biosynthesis protein TsaE
VLVESADAMRALGAQIARQLRAGDLVIASGSLGAGKTTLVQGLGEELGVEGEITSPTFIIAREHLGPTRLIHVDAYRLRPDGGGSIDPALALDDLDLDATHSIVVMEWGEGLSRVLSPEYLMISIDIVDDEKREVTITGVGPRWQGVRW